MIEHEFCVLFDLINNGYIDFATESVNYYDNANKSTWLEMGSLRGMMKMYNLDLTYHTTWSGKLIKLLLENDGIILVPIEVVEANITGYWTLVKPVFVDSFRILDLYDY